MKKLATGRNFCILMGIVLVAYALFGCFSDEILVWRSKGSSGGRKYVHGDMVYLAALGYVSLAVSAFLLSTQIDLKRSEVPASEFARRLAPFALFLAVGIIVLGALGVSVR
jgi:hypothetical protein